MSAQNENRELRLASISYDEHLKNALLDKRDIVDYLSTEIENKSTEFSEFKDRLHLYNQQKNAFLAEYESKLDRQRSVYEEKIEALTNEKLVLSKL
jgi:hypothetical protein